MSDFSCDTGRRLALLCLCLFAFSRCAKGGKSDKGGSSTHYKSENSFVTTKVSFFCGSSSDLRNERYVQFSPVVCSKNTNEKSEKSRRVVAEV